MTDEEKILEARHRMFDTIAKCCQDGLFGDDLSSAMTTSFNVVVEFTTDDGGSQIQMVNSDGRYTTTFGLLSVADKMMTHIYHMTR